MLIMTACMCAILFVGLIWLMFEQTGIYTRLEYLETEVKILLEDKFGAKPRT